MRLDLDHELDRLYCVEPGEFVAERTRLAGALRKEGRRAEAAGVAELRKPSLPVWTVNQLARRERKDVDLLLDAGHRLAAEQMALLSGGDPRSFDEAREREQAALRRLRQAARSILGDRASTGTLERVVTTLRAAAVSEDTREQLARGRLTSEIAPAGFEAFIRPAEALAGERHEPRSAARRDRAEKEAARRERLARGRADLNAAREREAAVAGRLREAERVLRQTRKHLDAAERETQRLMADREAAARAVEAARRELETARSSDS
jgi:hypothetical protein